MLLTDGWCDRLDPPRLRPTTYSLPERAYRMDRVVSPTHVVILGSTGSIGRSALSVIEHDGGARLRAWGLSGHTRWKELAAQARRASAAVRGGDRGRACATDGAGAAAARVSRSSAGLDGLVRMVQHPETDRVLSAIVGAVGLRGTWAALEAGKIVALANKETLVVAGPLVMELARARGARILPVDSEHSAIFQAPHGGRTPGGAPGGPDLLRRAVPGPVGAGAGPRHARGRAASIPPGGWGRRSRSTRPR